MTRKEAQLFIQDFIALRNSIDDELSTQVFHLYPTWKSGVAYNLNDKVLYSDTLYKVIIAHTSQEDWTPDISTSLFTKVLIPDENVIPEWEKPNSTNAYMTGDKIYYNGQIWISAIDYNLWSPDEYPAGWIKEG